ncbi:MAG: hypothetical protein MZW92_01700 [Comamonadaceae bacterium]|nr:hypothetical protein [Comamonadaceae bacterium]
MVAFERGHVGNAQFPVMYALGPPGAAYALFLDHLYRQRWDFTGRPWRVETRGEVIRGYLIVGPDLADLRRGYLELTGRPPVPPRQAFGLWVSEWGYDDWTELDDKLATLRAHRFPSTASCSTCSGSGTCAATPRRARWAGSSGTRCAFPTPGRGSGSTGIATASA